MGEEEDTLDIEPIDDDEDEDNVTVRIDDHRNEPVSPIEEPGLSVDPDDLGTQWLGTATEQNNFESSSKPEDDGMHVTRLGPRKKPGGH